MPMSGHTMDDEFAQAELAKLRAETARIQAENDHKMAVQIQKLIAETDKIRSENRWYPLVVGSGLTLAIVAIVKLFL